MAQAPAGHFVLGKVLPIAERLEGYIGRAQSLARSANVLMERVWALAKDVCLCCVLHLVTLA